MPKDDDDNANADKPANRGATTSRAARAKNPPPAGTPITIKLAKIEKATGSDARLVSLRDVAGVVTGPPLTRARWADERKAKITHDHDGLVPATWFDPRSGWRSTFVWLGDDFTGGEPYMIDESDPTKGCIAGAALLS
jgi:hypothetical protein